MLLGDLLPALPCVRRHGGRTISQLIPPSSGSKDWKRAHDARCARSRIEGYRDTLDEVVRCLWVAEGYKSDLDSLTAYDALLTKFALESGPGVSELRKDLQLNDPRDKRDALHDHIITRFRMLWVTDHQSLLFDEMKSKDEERSQAIRKLLEELDCFKGITNGTWNTAVIKKAGMDAIHARLFRGMPAVETWHDISKILFHVTRGDEITLTFYLWLKATEKLATAHLSSTPPPSTC